MSGTLQGSLDLAEAVGWVVDETTELPVCVSPDAGAPVRSAGSPSVAADVTGGGAASAALAEQQKDRLRAKNRRSQERAREKKKTAQSQTAEALGAAAADMERLRLENGRLSAANALMEQVLEVREGAAAVLEQDKAQQQSSPAKLHLPVLLGKLQASSPALPEGRAVACPLTGLSLSEVAAVKSSEPHIFIDRFRDIVARLRDALPQLTDPSSSDHTRATAEAEMDEALWEAGCMSFEHAVLKPQNMQWMLAASVDDGTGGEGERWARITAALELAPQQRRQLQPLRDVFVGRIARVVRERRAALRRLQAVRPPDSLSALQGVTAQYLELHEASTELATNLQEEHVSCMEFVAKGFGGILTPLQKAKAIVACSPAFPDIYSIATAALEEERQLGAAAAAHTALLAGV